MSTARDQKYIYHSPYTSKGAGKLEMVLKHNAYFGEQNEKLHTNIQRTLCYCLSHPTTLRWNLNEGILSRHPQGSGIRNFYGSSSRFSQRFDALLYNIRCV